MNTTAMAPLRHHPVSATPELVDRVRARLAATGQSAKSAGTAAVMDGGKHQSPAATSAPNGGAA